jgi:hypothetical protein
MISEKYIEIVVAGSGRGVIRVVMAEYPWAAGVKSRKKIWVRITCL